ncbi:MAG: type II toxin-antitoxin system VapC family toxin [Leptospiraceae bacterium]|nr:type II toxin-antitoxin system VapC family toxin [Leptospiraceae bacterium]MCP5493319.1 type II toxin-antitoxin system VapC family toxin [Leptospiraceae bacterium]
MRIISIDTNIYVAFKKGDSNITEVFRNCDIIYIDIMVIAELYTGFVLGSQETKNRKELEEFLNSSRVEILFHEIGTTEYYAAIFKQLKLKGKPIPTNDIWIAANAMKHGATLFSLDKHFQEIENLLLLKI